MDYTVRRMKQIVREVKDLPEKALKQSRNPKLYGGIAGLVVGATVGGLYATRVNLSFLPMSDKLTPLVGFLLGAGIYGYGLSTKRSLPYLSTDVVRSTTQVAGIVIAGANLGKLLASFSLPSFDLASEESDVVGYTGDGRVIGLQAEESDVVGFTGDGRVLGLQAEDDEAHDYVPNYSATAYNPTMTDTTMGGMPSWGSSATAVSVGPTYDAAVRSGMVMPMAGSVAQWYGSAEGITHKNTATNVGYNFSMVEGVGSVIGQ
jgi:hypothetical protein